MIEVDVRGLSCPLPVVKTKEALEKNPDETIVVLVDTAVSRDNVDRLARNKGFSVNAEESDGEFRLTIKKEGG
ncbi:MAG: sulfurtransferase TusA family protein [Actinomycetota bacterium]|nr:sulfurtransferase TusA family protein [Actinomycetota bacterium]